MSQTSIAVSKANTSSPFSRCFGISSEMGVDVRVSFSGLSLTLSDEDIPLASGMHTQGHHFFITSTIACPSTPTVQLKHFHLRAIVDAIMYNSSRVSLRSLKVMPDDHLS